MNEKVIGDEIMLRVLSCDEELKRVEIEEDIIMERKERLRSEDGKELKNMDMRIEDIDEGKLLSESMIKMNEWIEIDEIEIEGIGINEEIKSERKDIIGGMRDIKEIIGKIEEMRIVEIG